MHYYCRLLNVPGHHGVPLVCFCPPRGFLHYLDDLLVEAVSEISADKELLIIVLGIIFQV